MFGFRYIKFDPMDHVIHYRNGKVVREGQGLNFFYFAPNSSLVRVPMGSKDLPFIFRETTRDFQEISIQGQIGYRVADPHRLSESLDLTINGAKTYLTDDHEVTAQRLVNAAQTAVSAQVHAFTIKEVLRKHEEMEDQLLHGLKSSPVIRHLGLEVLSVTILAIKADPEMARALEAKTREALQQDADKAIYDRRNFAVEQEQKIKESELNTKIAVEEKERQIAEKKMENDRVKKRNAQELQQMDMELKIDLETKNSDLVKMKAANEKEMADAKEYALKAVMDVYRGMDWKVIAALNGDGQDSGSNIALAFRELAEKNSIGTLNISPDLLNSLLKNE